MRQGEIAKSSGLGLTQYNYFIYPSIPWAYLGIRDLHRSAADGDQGVGLSRRATKDGQQGDYQGKQHTRHGNFIELICIIAREINMAGRVV